MRWHSEHGMGHVWAPKDSPAAGATRYGHGLTRRRTRKKTGRRTTLAIYLWQNCGTDVIEISGVVVEPRWRYHNFYTFPEGATWMARTVCSEACLAAYLHENSFSVSRALAAHVTAPLPSGRAARSRRKSQLGYFLFGSVARLPGNSVWTQTTWNGTNDHE